MIRSLYTAATGMEAQQLNLDNTANNLANVGTAGFKKSRLDFQDLLYQTIRSAGATQAQGITLPTGIQVGMGTKPGASQKIFTTGDMQQTGNPLDVAIEGDGFFKVLLPSGDTAFTRDGSFKKSADGKLVTSDGYELSPAVTIPAEAKSVNVGEDGTVTAEIQGQAEPQPCGNIELVKFLNPAGLMSQGRNLYAPSAASGEPITGTPGQDGFGKLSSNYLELSNVKVVEEMVNLITAQRAYEVNSKSIQTADEMLNIANNLRR